MATESLLTKAATHHFC